MASSVECSVTGEVGDGAKGAGNRIQLTSVCGPMSGFADLPVFDVSEQGGAVDTLAREMAACMIRTGCLIIRDPDVDTADNDWFTRRMQEYFGQSTADKLEDARPDVHYQVGVTPPGVETPRCVVDPACLEAITQQAIQDRPIIPTGADPKWRFFWRLGPGPTSTDYSAFNSAPVLPKGFPDWAELMDSWGAKLLAALKKSADLLALGLRLPQDAFSELMEDGPHLLGPTGVDLEQHMNSDETVAGYHYDLNLMTIHGKSPFPGLYIWLANGRRMPVRIPEGCLLIQAGKQLEWLTAGTIKAGMHEVICSESTRVAVEKAKQEGKSLWRTSSTVFGHVASDKTLQPLGAFADLPSAEEYPPTKAGDYVQQELKQIALRRSPVKA